MNGAVLLHLLTYTSVLTFVAAVAFRFYRIASMPLHLRWEIYPVAHETGEKARYGGSVLEEVDWWTKPRRKSLINELKATILEMIFLVALFRHNRKLWYWSFPFHFGLYLLVLLLGLLILGSIRIGPGIPVIQLSGLEFFLLFLTKITALLGLVLATLGAAELLLWRLTSEELRDYTPPAAIFNLLFFLVVFAVAWANFLFVDSDFVLSRAYIRSLLTFNLSVPAGHPLLALEIVLTGLLIAYIPLTHMSHFFIKWFTYHKILWDDEPNIPNSSIEKKILEQVQYPVTWAAPHIKADGKKNWADIAGEEIDP
ncbi:MAG TPA: nitrate reductase [bacterium]|nr:nitrate reductase [bacterium]HQQ00015.1 nitrate reductase [bacterium]